MKVQISTTLEQKMMPIKNEQIRKIKKKHETKHKLRTGGAAKYKLGLVPDAMARAGGRETQAPPQDRCS